MTGLQRHRPAELVGLVQPDGSVRVPGYLAGDVLRRLARDLIREADGHGVIAATPDAQRLLNGLYEAAERYRHQPATHTTDVDQPTTQAPTMTVRDMADQMGCTPRRVRQMLETGQLTGHKSGRTWIIHVGRPSLRPFPFGEAPQPNP